MVTYEYLTTLQVAVIKDQRDDPQQNPMRGITYPTATAHQEPGEDTNNYVVQSLEALLEGLKYTVHKLNNINLKCYIFEHFQELVAKHHMKQSREIAWQNEKLNKIVNILMKRQTTAEVRSFVINLEYLWVI